MPRIWQRSEPLSAGIPNSARGDSVFVGWGRDSPNAHETEREFGALSLPFKDIHDHPFNSDSGEDSDEERGIDSGCRASLMEVSPMSEWTEEKYSRLGKALFKPRKVRQFFAGETLVRESELKKVSYEELLLDLCVVFNLAFLSHTLKHGLEVAIYSGGNSEGHIEKFLLVLGLLFMAWRSNALRFNILTTIGTDLASKLEILVLVIAFTGIGVGLPTLLDEGGKYMTAVSGFLALVIPSIVVIVGAWTSPLRVKSRGPFFNHAVFRGICQIVAATPYAIVCVAPLRFAKIFYYAGFMMNLSLDFITDLGLRHFLQSMPDSRFYALSIETWTERHALLTLVSFGESALTLLYVVDKLFQDPHNREQTGSIFLGIVGLFILLFSYVTQYFEIDNRVAQGFGSSHAVRRSVTACILWSLCHYVTIFGLVFTAASYGILLSEWYPIATTEHDLLASTSAASQSDSIINAGLFLTCAETIVSLSLVGLSACHKKSRREVTKPYRLVLRVVLALVLLATFIKLGRGRILPKELQWAYVATQAMATVVEFAVVRMDAAGWWLKRASPASDSSE